MPIIPVRLADDGATEWAMIELQGELEVDGGLLDGQEIGELQVDAKGNATFRIGQHRLSGKQEGLSEPFAVMRKIYERQDQAMDTMDDDESEKRVSELEVVAVIKRKLIFKNRPDTIVSDCFKVK